MVEIYLQEVVPRVQKLWDKLGKKPKKREIKTIDIQALKEEMKKAEDEHKKIEADEKRDKPAAAQAEEKKILKYDYVVDISDNLTFSNGVAVASLQELSDVMPNINGPTLRHHVTKDHNDIADWVKSKFRDDALAEKLRACKATEEFVKVLEDDKAKNNKPIDASKMKDGATSENISGDTLANTPEPAKQPPASASSPLTSAASSSPSSGASSAPQAVINPDTGEGESVAWIDIQEKLKNMDNNERLTLLEKSVKKYPQDINIKFPLALLYHKLKNYENSEKMYKEILGLYPKNTKALFYLGGLMKAQRRYDDALRYLNMYMDLKRNDPKVRELVRHIEEKNKK
jgi:tetratricopeptide (TPR) repeat protein